MFRTRIETIITMKEWAISQKLISMLYPYLLANIDGYGEPLQALFAKLGMVTELKAYLNDSSINKTNGNSHDIIEQRRKAFSSAILYGKRGIVKFYLENKLCDFEFAQLKHAWEGNISYFKMMVNLKKNPEMAEHIKKTMSVRDCKNLTIFEYAFASDKGELVKLLIDEFPEYIDFPSLPLLTVFTGNTNLTPLFMDKLMDLCHQDPSLMGRVFSDELITPLFYFSEKMYKNPAEVIHSLIDSVKNEKYRLLWGRKLTQVSITYDYAYFFPPSQKNTQIDLDDDKLIATILIIWRRVEDLEYERNSLKLSVEMFAHIFKVRPGVKNFIIEHLKNEMHEKKIYARFLKELVGQSGDFNLQYKRTGAEISLDMFDLSSKKAPFELFKPLQLEFKELINRNETEEQDYTYALYLSFINSDYTFAKECYEASSLSRHYDGSIDDIFTYFNRYIFVLMTEFEVKFDLNYLDIIKNNLKHIVKADPNDFSLLFDAMFFASFQKIDKSLDKVYRRLMLIPFPNIDQSKITNDEHYIFKYKMLSILVFELLGVFITLNNNEEEMLKNFYNNIEINQFDASVVAKDNLVTSKLLIAKLMTILNAYKLPSMGEKIELTPTMFTNPEKVIQETMDDIGEIKTRFDHYVIMLNSEKNARELIRAEEDKMAKEIARKEAKKNRKAANKEKIKSEKNAALKNEIAALSDEIKLLESQVTELNRDKNKAVEQFTHINQLRLFSSQLNSQMNMLDQHYISYNEKLKIVQDDLLLLNDLHNIYNHAISYGVPSSVAKLFQQFPRKIYLVGGAVRDLELKIRPPKDFDLVAFAKVIDVKKIYPDAKVIGEGEYSSVCIMIDGVKHDIALLKEESDLSHEMILKRNSYKRDFTINAEYLGFGPTGILRIDPWSAAKHRAERKIELINIDMAADIFFLRPERYLRLINIMHYTHFECSKTIISEITKVHENQSRFIGSCKDNAERVKRQVEKLIDDYGVDTTRTLLLQHKLFYPLLKAEIITFSQLGFTPAMVPFMFLPPTVTRFNGESLNSANFNLNKQ